MNDIEWVANNIDDLKAHYLNKWIAVRRGRVLGSDRDLKSLINWVGYRCLIVQITNHNTTGTAFLSAQFLLEP